MMKFVPGFRITSAILLACAVSGCQTVKLPKIDIMKSPEFVDEAANFAKEKDYPDVKDAPPAPTDIRSDKQWDSDVRSLQALRDNNDGVKMESGPTDREAENEFNRLKAKAQAYKKADPKSGPVDPIFPKPKPRR